MVEVVGVVFPSGVKVYHFDPAGLELSEGDRVVVQTSSGPEIGEVVEPIHEVEDSEVAAALKKVQRVATKDDLQTQAESDDLRRQALSSCRELIKKHGLDMKLVDADVSFGGEKITFSFCSEERVDFRALVSDLGKALDTRVEMRQVGAREEARKVGGLGPCGRGLCCATFAGNDEPVSIRMAKEQNLPLNPTKISGLCGRLMCCLKYEQEQYVKFRKEGPAKGTKVICPGCEGVVCGYVFAKEAVSVRQEDGSVVDIRLSTCEEQKDGSLLVVPEEEPVPLAPWFDGAVGAGRAGGLTSAEGGAGPSEGADDGKAGETDGQRSGRSRKSRRRRRGRGQGQGQGQAQKQGQGQGGGQQGNNAARPKGARPDSSQGKGGGGQGSGQREGGGGGSSRSRRRRRSRRPGGGQGGGQSGNSGTKAQNGGPGQS